MAAAGPKYFRRERHHEDGPHAKRHHWGEHHAQRHHGVRHHGGGHHSQRHSAPQIAAVGSGSSSGTTARV